MDSWIASHLHRSTGKYQHLSRAVPDDTPCKESGEDGFGLGEKKYSGISQMTRLHWLSLLNLFLFAVQFVLLISNTTRKISKTHDLVDLQYGRNFDYMSLDHQFDELWSDRAIDTAGVFIIKNHGGRFDQVEHGAITMFHQLHCLQALRKALQQGREGKYVALDYKMSRHWPHCLWYLRQSILCDADGYIERETSWNGTSGFIDGADDVRSCGKAEVLYKMFDERSE